MEIDWKGIGIARLVMGIALYTLLLMGHEWAFGVSAMPAGEVGVLLVPLLRQP